MSRNYDHHWKKGYEKPGVNQRRQVIRGGKPKLNAVQIAGDELRKAEGRTDDSAENLRRIGEYAGTILLREGIALGEFVPADLPTRLMLAGKDMDARWVTRYIDAKVALNRAQDAERAARTKLLDASPKPSRVRKDTPAPAAPPKPVPAAATKELPRLRSMGGWVGRGVIDPNPPEWHRTVPPWKDGPCVLS